MFIAKMMPNQIRSIPIFSATGASIGITMKAISKKSMNIPSVKTRKFTKIRKPSVPPGSFEKRCSTQMWPSAALKVKLKTVEPIKMNITKKTIPAVTTGQIYKGSIAFIVLQLIMVAVIMINPEIVSGGITKVKRLSADQVENLLEIDTVDYGAPALELPGAAAGGDLQLPILDNQDVAPEPNLDMGQDSKPAN